MRISMCVTMWGGWANWWGGTDLVEELVEEEWRNNQFPGWATAGSAWTRPRTLTIPYSNPAPAQIWSVTVIWEYTTSSAYCWSSRPILLLAPVSFSNAADGLSEKSNHQQPAARPPHPNFGPVGGHLALSSSPENINSGFLIYCTSALQN